LYSAAPFDAGAASAMLPHAHALLLNEIEAQQLEAATGRALIELPVPHIIVTLGSKGARWIETGTGKTTEVTALRVTAVDTTGAGDTFAGYIASALARGLSPEDAMRLATKAAALKVTRKGTADAIPSLAEVEAFNP
jgi:ribokinase